MEFEVKEEGRVSFMGRGKDFGLYFIVGRGYWRLLSRRMVRS